MKAKAEHRKLQEMRFKKMGIFVRDNNDAGMKLDLTDSVKNES
jgi:hypothetical protein